jgi:hypothetical protein
MRRYITSAFGAPLEVLQEKRGSTPLLHLFLELELMELDVFGREICGAAGVELFFAAPECCQTPP